MNIRQELLDDIAGRLVRFLPEQIIRVAIDGVDGAGKTTFADDLADIIRRTMRPVIRASVDGFHNPRSVRYNKGQQSPEGFFHDSYNYAALKQHLLDPLGPDGSGTYLQAVFDHDRDAPVSVAERDASPFAVLLLDGIFLHRPELRSHWDASIFLRVDVAISVARCAARDGTSPDPHAAANRRYVEGQRIYLRECSPEQHAMMVIDYNDLSKPGILASRGL